MTPRPGRRAVLQLLGLAPLAPLAMVAGCGRAEEPAATVTPSDRRASMVKIPYGDDASQFGDLHLPPGEGSVPVVVVVHGGYWGAAYGNELGTPLAKDLAAHGLAAWNIEYRRIGIGGGWPGTFADAAAATDALAGTVNDAAGGRLDLARVVVLGHSAGGHIAAWLSARHRLTTGQVGASPKVRPVGYVAQAGVLDLVSGFEQGLGDGAVDRLMGGSPTTLPERYAIASPYALLPYGVPGTLVHGLDDEVVPIGQSDHFAAQATRLGDTVTEVRLPRVDHFMLIDPSTPAWAACRDAATGYLKVT